MHFNFIMKSNGLAGGICTSRRREEAFSEGIRAGWQSANC